MKILFRIAAVLLILTVLAFVALGFFIDSAAKAAVEEGGTFAMGVDTRVESVDVGFLSGKFGMSELNIANPQGFEAADFFSLKTAKLEIDTSSFSGGAIVIPQILVEGVTLEIEQTPDGANYGKILENLQRFDSGEDEPASPEEPSEPGPAGEAPKFIVHNIKMQDVKAHVKLDVLGKQSDFTIPVPNFTIENLGNTEDSQSITELITTILKETLSSVAENGGGLLPEDMVDDIKDQLSNSADKLVDDLGADLQNLLKGEGDKDDLKKTAKDTAKELEKGLKGLLGKD